MSAASITTNGIVFLCLFHGHITCSFNVVYTCFRLGPCLFYDLEIVMPGLGAWWLCFCSHQKKKKKIKTIIQSVPSIPHGLGRNAIAVAAIVEGKRLWSWKLKRPVIMWRENLRLRIPAHHHALVILKSWGYHWDFRPGFAFVSWRLAVFCVWPELSSLISLLNIPTLSTLLQHTLPRGPEVPDLQKAVHQCASSLCWL